MADSSRPVSPYLPPEITSRILHFIYREPSVRENNFKEQSEFSKLARISSSWRVSTQRQSFRVISIRTSTQLLMVLNSIQGGFGELTRKQFINTRPGDSTAPADVFQLLKSTPKLETLRFHGPSFISFSPRDQLWIKHNPSLFLPNVTTLDLFSTNSDWSNRLFSCLISSCSKLDFLETNFTSSFSGDAWQTKGPQTWKKLKINQADFLKVWDVRDFKGLESLHINFAINLIFHDQVEVLEENEFFEIVGPTLIKLDVRGVRLPLLIYATLINLKDPVVDFQQFPDDQLESIIFSLNISRLAIRCLDGDFHKLSLSNLHLLEHLEIVEVDSTIDWSLLPKNSNL